MINNHNTSLEGAFVVMVRALLRDDLPVRSERRIGLGKRQTRAIAAFGSAALASCNRTCELGMTRATGEDYRHVLELLDEATAG